MGKLAFWVWLVMGPTLMGIFILVIVTVPALGQNEMKLMIPAVIAGGVVAIPFSILVAKMMKKITKI